LTHLHHTDNAAALALPVKEPIIFLGAGPEHIGAIWELIDEASRSSSVLPRSKISIQEHLGHFVVAVTVGRVIGCAVLHRMSPTLAEIRSVVAAPRERRRGVGRGLVLKLIGLARSEGYRRVFTLTDVPGFFESLGFSPTGKDTLPEKVWNDCIHCPKFDNCVETALDILLDD
jgi:amino-acid N-acetyltransferase